MDKEMFMRHVSFNALGCWIWMGAKTKSGHGKVRFGREHKMHQAHRVSWLLFRGDIPDGMWVLHNCPDGDDARCVNPAHLYLGDRADNNRDAIKKGQFPRGENSFPSRHPERLSRGKKHSEAIKKTLSKMTIWWQTISPEKLSHGEGHYNTKISSAQVQEIRALHLSGMKQTQIADMFNVSKSQIHKIVTWKERKRG